MGTTKKCGNKKSDREHNSNSLQRHSHVLVVSMFSPPIHAIFTGGVMTDPYIFIHPFWNVQAHNHDDL